MSKRSLLYKAKCKIEYCKAQVRLCESTFRDLLKSTALLTTLFALSNLWMARKHLMGMGELRTYPKNRAKPPSKQDKCGQFRLAAARRQVDWSVLDASASCLLLAM
ncbi:protein of unknown function [Pseudomonas inefficax]|uniref:Transposase DDE domain-containing protein n=1 Tax=Pseudomonas inefficax TaxID=2078786 RepID=A0AAQ1SUU9_9PSED|nr:protein of unknown function [Pseudomonas inefficax]